MAMSAARVLLVMPLVRCTAAQRTERTCLSDATAVPNILGRPIRLRWDPWETSQLATNVAAILLKEQLGFGIEFVPGGPVYEAVAAGDVDAAFEVWPAGKEQAFLQYASFHNDGGVRAYNTSIEGRSGVFEACSRDPGSALRLCKDARILGTTPFLDELLDTAEGEAYFAETRADRRGGLNSWTPSHCVGRNCSVEIFHIRPDYDTGLVEGMVSDLRLPARVAYLGEDSHRSAVWAAHVNRSAALFYYYSPGISFRGITLDSMPRVTTASGRDLPRTFLQKLIRADLEDRDGLDAVAFVDRFALGDADYAELLMTHLVSQDAASAACTWVKAHRATWAPWIDFPERRKKSFPEWFLGECATWEMGDRPPCARGCTALVFLQLTAGALLSLFMFCCWPLPRCLKYRHRANDIPFRAKDTIKKALSDKLVIEDFRCTYAQRTAFERACLSPPVVIQHVRTLSAFRRPNVDPQLRLPPDFPAERWNGGTERLPLYTFGFFSGTFIPVLLRCAALALLSSGQASLVWMWLKYRAHQVAAGFRTDITSETIFADWASTADNVISSFGYFPAFLQLGYVSYAVNQWRKFLGVGYSIQGRIHDVALMVGGAVVDPGSEECGQLAFKVHRFLTLSHLLIYQPKSRWLEALDIGDLIDLGLLTAPEAEHLEPARGKMWNSVLAELSWEIQRGLEQGLLRASCTVTCLDQLARLRAFMAEFRDAFCLTVPNLYSSMMTAVVDMLMLVFVVGTPYTTFLSGSGCFQANVFVATVFLTLPWICCMAMISAIMRPYEAAHDFFNVDALICSSEQVSFHNLRIALDLSPHQRGPLHSDLPLPQRGESGLSRQSSAMLPNVAVSHSLSTQRGSGRTAYSM